MPPISASLQEMVDMRLTLHPMLIGALVKYKETKHSVLPNVRRAQEAYEKATEDHTAENHQNLKKF